MEGDLNLKLGLGLPGREESEQQSSSCLNNNNNNNNKRSSSNMDDRSSCLLGQEEPAAPPPKAQVVGWPPVRSYRRNVVKAAAAEEMFVKVSMDGAPYLRKIDLKLYNTYFDLLKGLEEMFKWYNGSEHAPTYEDKDGDWMLLGDVPWDMFITSCKRLRIIKASDAKGLGASS